MWHFRRVNLFLKSCSFYFSSKSNFKYFLIFMVLTLVSKILSVFEFCIRVQFLSVTIIFSKRIFLAYLISYIGTSYKDFRICYGVLYFPSKCLALNLSQRKNSIIKWRGCLSGEWKKVRSRFLTILIIFF